jgi:redox-sensitive bicupin YhaK (pirin superfamily)
VPEEFRDFPALAKPFQIEARGCPATGQDPSVATRFPAEAMASITSGAASQRDRPARSEAIRHLVELGLKAKTKLNPPPNRRERQFMQYLRGSVWVKGSAPPDGSASWQTC